MKKISIDEDENLRKQVLSRKIKETTKPEELKKLQNTLRKGEFLLNEACEKGDLERVKLLTKLGVREKDIREEVEYLDTRIKNLKEKEKQYVGEYDGQLKSEFKIQVLDLMIKKELFLREEVVSKKSALCLAIKSYNHELVEFLINEGYDIERKNEKGETPLFTAYNQQDNKIVDILLKHGVNIEAKDNYDNTVMHQACFAQDIEAVLKFVAAGSDLFCRNKAGKLPIDLWPNNESKGEIQIIYDKIQGDWTLVAKDLDSDFLNALNYLDKCLLETRNISKSNFIKNVLNIYVKGKDIFTQNDYFLISLLVQSLGDEVVEINKKLDEPFTVKILGYHNNFIKSDNIKEIISSSEENLDMILTVFCTLQETGRANYDLLKQSMNKSTETSNIIESIYCGDLLELNSSLNELIHIFSISDEVKTERRNEDIKQQQYKFFLSIGNPYHHIKKIANFWQKQGDKYIKILEQQENSFFSYMLGSHLNVIEKWMLKNLNNYSYLKCKLAELKILDEIEVEILAHQDEMNLGNIPDFSIKNISEEVVITEKKEVEFFPLTEKERFFIAKDERKIEGKAIVESYMEWQQKLILQKIKSGEQVNNDFNLFFDNEDSGEEVRIAGDDTDN